MRIEQGFVFKNFLQNHNSLILTASFSWNRKLALLKIIFDYFKFYL